jgi:hypothetical protein
VSENQKNFEEGLNTAKVMVLRRLDDARNRAQSEKSLLKRAAHEGAEVELNDLYREINALLTESEAERLDRALEGRLLAPRPSESYRAAPSARRA